jgi:hypothetical protein
MLQSPDNRGFARLFVFAARAGLRSHYKGANKRRRMPSFVLPQGWRRLAPPPQRIVRPFLADASFAARLG